MVFRDLKAYMDRKKIYGRVFRAGMTGRETEPSVSAITTFDSRLMLADLLVALHKIPEAKTEYARLEAEQPGRPDLAQSIGELALAEGDRKRGRQYFEKAYDEGDADPQMCAQLALLEKEERERPEQIIPILERALKSKPDYTEARILLGLAMIDARDFPGGIARLMEIPEVKPDRAAAVYCGLSYARLETGDTATARQNAGECRKWAKTDSDKLLGDQLLTLATARSEPSVAVRPGEKWQRVAGTALGVECSAEGNRLQVAAGSKAILFDLPTIAAVETSRMPAGFGSACGALKPIPVTVEYAPPRSVMETSAGIVRRIAFGAGSGAPN